MKTTKKKVLITALVLAVLALAFLMGAYFGRIEDCCVSPQAQQEHWFFTTIKILAAISGPIGGGIALWIAVFGDRQANRRFRIALRKDYILDKKADERQQAEWNRAGKIEQAERLAVVENLAFELEQNEIKVEQMLAEVSALEDSATGDNIDLTILRKGIRKFVEANKHFRVERPVYSNLGTSVGRLPSDTMAAIIVYEPALYEAAHLTQKLLNIESWRGINSVQWTAELKAKLGELLAVLNDYVADITPLE